VAVQPLYPVLGDEYYHLLQVADAACSAKKVKEVVVGYPLFGAPHDIERIVETSLAGYPEKRNGNEAVVLMFPKTYHRFVEFY
jgi:cobalamin biosynthesis Co2+ chelatase CbiK